VQHIDSSSVSKDARVRVLQKLVLLLLLLKDNWVDA